MLSYVHAEGRAATRSVRVKVPFGKCPSLSVDAAAHICLEIDKERRWKLRFLLKTAPITCSTSLLNFTPRTKLH